MIKNLSIVAEAARVADWNDKRRETALRITRVARDLTVDHGFDGFTLDDLATAAEVSRRTLFNYFDGKMEAVLGLPPAVLDGLLTTFLAGGPTGRLFEDACVLGRAVVERKDVSRADLIALQRVLDTNPKVLAACAMQFRRLTDEVLQLAAERERCDPGEPHVAVLVATLLALFEATMRAFLRDGPPDAQDHEHDGRRLGELFDTHLGALRDLIAVP